MFYIIDFDTGVIESKSKTETPLLKYIVQNKLELSVALVSNTEEIYLKLSLREMKRVWKTNGYTSELRNEEDAAERLFFQMHNIQRRIPTFSKKLGKQLIKAAKKKYPEVKSKKKPNQLKLIFGKFK